MVNPIVAFFMIHPNRSKEAFIQLIADWKGILISDHYGVYVKWVNKRQACLAHLIRKARALTEAKDESIRSFGEAILEKLQLLCHWAKKPPDETQWTKFDTRNTGGVKIDELMNALDQLKVPAADKIRVLYAIKAAGALRADIIATN